MSETEIETPTAEGELVIGLVGPVGSNLRKVEAALVRTLERFIYDSKQYRLSEFFADERLSGLLGGVHSHPEYERLASAMDAGDDLRKKTRTPEIMAIYAVSRIAGERPMDPDGRSSPGIASHTSCTRSSVQRDRIPPAPVRPTLRRARRPRAEELRVRTLEG
ncbi:MAG: hypothetical protein R3A51_10450 [Nannocystaceae bacterium]